MPRAASAERTAATLARTASATAAVSCLAAPLRRGVSAMATRSAVTASSAVSLSHTPSATSRAATVTAVVAATAGGGAEQARLGQRVEHGQGDRLGRVGVGAQRGRVELAQHLAQRDRGGVPADGQRGVGGQHRLEAANSRGVGATAAESAPACSARASPTARRSAARRCTSSRDSSSANRSAKSSAVSSSV